MSSRSSVDRVFDRVFPVFGRSWLLFLLGTQIFPLSHAHVMLINSPLHFITELKIHHLYSLITISMLFHFRPKTLGRDESCKDCKISLFQTLFQTLLQQTSLLKEITFFSEQNFVKIYWTSLLFNGCRKCIYVVFILVVSFLEQ